MPSETPMASGGSAPFVIELLGVPGSGKTTVADRLVERLQRAGIDAATMTGLARRRAAATTVGKLVCTVVPRRLQSPLLWWIFYGMGTLRGIGLIRRDFALARFVTATLWHRPRSVASRRHILFWFLQLAGRHHLLVDGSTGAQVVVIDDGFVHRAVHLHATHRREPDRESVLRYLDLIPLPDLLVRVDAEPSVCLERVIDRGVWAHSPNLSQRELGDYLTAAHSVVETVAQAMRTTATTVIEVSGTDDPDTIADELGTTVVAELTGPEPSTTRRGTGRILRLPRRSRITSSLAARWHDASIGEETLEAALDQLSVARVGTARNIWLSRRNRNMVVATESGPKVVKVYRPQWTPATVECAHSILRRLEQVGFRAPRLVRSPLGADQVTTAEGIVAVFDFIEGQNLSMYYLLRPDRLNLTAQAGSTLAELHMTLDGFTPSGEHHLGFAALDGPRRRDVPWFAGAIEELIDRSRELAEPEAVACATALTARSDETYGLLEQLDRKLGDASLPRLVVHGDYGVHNLLFRRTLPAVPVDFELSRLDWRVYDLISALGKHRFKDGSYDFESMEAFQRGYSSRFPLSEQEVALFPDAWRLYKLQAAIQYWNSYFLTDGPVRKLNSALDSLDQADWVATNGSLLSGLAAVGVDRVVNPYR